MALPAYIFGGSKVRHAVGDVFSGLKDFMFGSSGKIKALPNMTKEQQTLAGQLFQSLGVPLEQGMQYLSSLMEAGPEATQAFEAPYMRQFHEQILPGIAEKFAGLGAQESSAYQAAIAQAGAGLEEKLALMREGLRSHASEQLSNYLNTAMGIRPFQYQTIPGQQGFAQSMAPYIGKMIGSGFGMEF